MTSRAQAEAAQAVREATRDYLSRTDWSVRPTADEMEARSREVSRDLLQDCWDAIDEANLMFRGRKATYPQGLDASQIAELMVRLHDLALMQPGEVDLRMGKALTRPRVGIKVEDPYALRGEPSRSEYVPSIDMISKRVRFLRMDITLGQSSRVRSRIKLLLESAEASGGER